MTLSFSQQWPKSMPNTMAGENTLFPLKILKSLDTDYPAAMHAFKISRFFNYRRFKGYSSEVWRQINPKIHTIREDKTGRWKPDTKIHFVINSRTKDRHQFAPVLKVKGIQKIEIKRVDFEIRKYYSYVVSTAFSGEKYRIPYEITVDGNFLNREEVEKLVINDGFESPEQFFSWFNKDFTGKLIHWTYLKY